MARAPPQRERGGKSGQRDNEKEEGEKNAEEAQQYHVEGGVGKEVS